MRDWMLLVGVVVLVPLALRNAFTAFLIWGWTAIIAIDGYANGFMQSARLNLLFGVLTLVMLVFGRSSVPGSWKDNKVVMLLLIFLFHGTLCAVFAYEGNSSNWDLYDKLVKTIIFVSIMPLVVVGRVRIHAMMIMLCLGLGFHGVIDGLKFIASAGGHVVHGLQKFGDNNHFAVVLSMTIPLLLYVSNFSKNRIVRWAAMVGSLLCIAAVLGTRSRGGFVSLLAVGSWLIYCGRLRPKNLLLLAGAGVLVIGLASSEWSARMQTIKSAEEDRSFASRVEAWQVSSAIALTNPMFGGGFHSVQAQRVWSQFRGEKGLIPFFDYGIPSPNYRAAHSVYFEVLGDLGFVGLAIFLTLISGALLTGRSIRRTANAAGPPLAWARDLSVTLTAVIIGFLVGGLTVSIAYYEIIYIAIMLMEVLKREVSSVGSIARAG